MAELLEKAVEDRRHEVPGGAGVDAEAVAFDAAGAATGVVVALEQRHLGASVGEIAGCGEPAEAGADDHDRIVTHTTQSALGR